MKTFGKVVLHLTLVVAVFAVTTGRPPAIVKQPAQDVFFKAGETLELLCEAEGSPVPAYTWKRNGIDFNPSGFDDRVYQRQGVGTVVFARPEDIDQGVYQCFATNPHGTSLSVTVKLWEAKLKEFVTEADQTARPSLGHQLTLSCVPPESIPLPVVFWVLLKPAGGSDPVSLDARVTMDLEYRLRFANVRRSDGAGGRAYACLAFNNVMRRSTIGPHYFLNPENGTEQLRPVTYMWAPPEDSFGIRGDNLTLKCIFAGNPTPEVHWERTDGQPLSDRVSVQSFGQELVISDLQDGDAGPYCCWATNNNTLTPVNRTIDVYVESRPEWVEEPRDMEVAVGDTANITCLADSVPQPWIYWFVNGVLLDQVRDPRLTGGRVERVSPDNIVFSNLTRDDSLVVQCNATNKLGYAWADFFLHVAATATTEPSVNTVTTGRPPAIVQQPAQDVFFNAGETLELPCEAEGSPVPVYTWKRNGIDFNPSGFDDRVYQRQGVGTVVFARPEDIDQGEYQCFATNPHGTSLSVIVKLWEAKLKEFVTEADQTARPSLGHQLTLSCVPPESIPLPVVFWVLLKPAGGYDPVSLDARVTMDLEYRLRFANVRRSDGAGGRAYACLALNNVMRRSTIGPHYFLNPENGTEQLRPVTYMWESPEDSFGIRGDNLTLKCIFAGNPTPEVHWERTDGQPLSDRVSVQSFGQELVISDLQDGDDGPYSCWAINNNTLTPVNRTIGVRVESRPKWVEEPRDMEVAVGDTANITCLADSVPQPTIYWFVNGVPLVQVTDPRLEIVSPDNIVFSNLTRDGSLVVQCNATNKHGYAWADFILHVAATATTEPSVNTVPTARGSDTASAETVEYTPSDETTRPDAASDTSSLAIRLGAAGFVVVLATVLALCQQ